MKQRISLLFPIAVFSLLTKPTGQQDDKLGPALLLVDLVAGLGEALDDVAVGVVPLEAAASQDGFVARLAADGLRK